MTCKHDLIQTFRLETGEPVMWACAECRAKFVPMRQLMDEVVAEREARLMALNTELVDALRWYVDTDEVSEMEGNEFWLDGRDRARAALAKVEEGK